MAEIGVGVLPICGADDRVTGMVAGRDIVVKVLARGLNLHTSTPGNWPRARR